MKLFLLLIYISESIYFIKTFTSTVCLINRYDTIRVCKGRSNSLSCDYGEVIMIKNIHYAKSRKHYGSCSYCLKNVSNPDWNINPIFFKNKVFNLCSQQSNCLLDGTFEAPPDFGEKQQLWHAVISYECIDKGTINDICSPFEATINKNDTLHLSILGTDIASKQCNCIAYEIEETTAINIVDYRQYSADKRCIDSSVFYVNGVQKFQCLENSSNENSHVYNTNLNITDFKTNMTVSFKGKPPKMFWITIKGVNVLVQCNMAEESFSRFTSVTTPFENKGISLLSQEVTSHKSSDKVEHTTSCEFLQTSVNSKVSQTPAIVGSTVAIVALTGIMAITVLIYRRRSCLQQKTDINEVVYYNEGNVTGESIDNPEFENKGDSYFKVDNQYMNVSNALRQNRDSISGIYLNENIDLSPIAEATNDERTRSRPTEKNMHKENCNQETFYNALETSVREHTYSALGRNTWSVHEYYN